MTDKSPEQSDQEGKARQEQRARASQVRGLALILLAILLFTLWRLWHVVYSR